MTQDEPKAALQPDLAVRLIHWIDGVIGVSRYAARSKRPLVTMAVTEWLEVHLGVQASEELVRDLVRVVSAHAIVPEVESRVADIFERMRTWVRQQGGLADDEKTDPATPAVAVESKSTGPRR